MTNDAIQVENGRRNGIGIRNEKSLHAAIKQWYALPGDLLEQPVDGYVVDMVRGPLLIEIQTRNLSALRRKLHALVLHHPVRLVYPIARDKWIVHVGKRGAIKRRRKSPKRGTLSDLFDELVSLPDLFNYEGFEVQVLLIEEEEVRVADGKGSWRRKGESIRDRRLIRVLDQTIFSNGHAFLRFLPDGMVGPFSNAGLAKEKRIPIHTARQITFCLKKMGVIREAGREGRSLFFEIIRENRP